MRVHGMTVPGECVFLSTLIVITSSLDGPSGAVPFIGHEPQD